MAARGKEVKKLGLSDLGVTRGTPAEEVLDVTDAEQRKAGEVIEDDGSAVEKIVALLVKAKVV
jgi:electron transfer flavoprotein alpha/beta subunit